MSDERRRRLEYEVAEGVRPVYELDVEIAFIGPENPPPFNRAAPEVNDAVRDAIDGLKCALREHGYEIARTGYGSLRMQ